MIGPEELQEVKWYTVEAEEALKKLEASKESGLSAEEAKKRIEQFGPNELTQEQPMGPLMRFILQFHQPLVYILLAAGAAAGLLGEYVDSGVIFGVVLVNSIVGFVQEQRAVKTLDALAKSVITEVTVLRDGKRQRLDSGELVPGDIVVLRSGDKVPADLRLVAVRDLQCDESALTGESVPVEKSIKVLDEDTGLGDRANQAYSGSLITYGTGTGVVVGTGDRTEVGKISEMISSAEELDTPLTRKITHFSHILLWAILALAFVTFLLALWRGTDLVEGFMASVALAVAAIPEGLPAVVTITLAIGVARMARRRAIIRKLPAVETLGSTSVICTDKTGTLTENQMTVQAIYAGGERYEATGAGYNPEGSISKGEEEVSRDNLPPALYQTLRAGFLCNDSQVVESEGAWKAEGNPTEAALIVSALKAGVGSEELRQECPRIDALPFESAHKYMATLHDHSKEGERVVIVKGAVEVLLEKCGSSLDADGNQIPLEREKVEEQVEEMASHGLRVLALTRFIVRGDKDELKHEDISEGLVLLGIQGMMDPPRKAAVDAVQECQRAGINVKMITGDHAKTAVAIAKQIGFAGLEEKEKAGEKLAYTGRELEKVSDDDLVGVARKTSVFARVTPEQKLRLVRALQRDGSVIAMTGDGVNDAPALKQADIGVAMGITGTEVSKDASDMVLTDDNFESIKAAVEEGRGVFDNLTKFIVYILPTNLGQAMLILTAMAAGATLPVSPVQVLWINMMTAIALGLTLAFEPKEPGIMRRMPRDPKQPILTMALGFRMVLVALVMLAGGFGLFLYEYGGEPENLEVARTAAVNVIIMIQIFYLFNCRSLHKSVWSVGFFSNKWLWLGVAVMLVAQVLFTYAPFMNFAFGTAPTTLLSWSVVVAAGVAAATIVAIEKYVQYQILGKDGRSEADQASS